MYLTEKLRHDLKRIFHGADPLMFVENARILTTTSGDFCEVTLRVPTVTEAAYQVYCNGAYWPENPLNARAQEHHNCKCSQKILDPMEATNALKPKRIIYSGPKTVVFWPDGTKTMVSRMEGQEHDEYGAFCAAVVKKMFGATHKAKKFLDTIKVVQEPKVKKAEEEKPWEQMEMMPMPGTEDPNWGEKHWGAEEEE